MFSSLQAIVKQTSIFLTQTHTLIGKSFRLCIIIMSSHSLHLIDTNQLDFEGAKNWFEVCQFNHDNGSNYRVWTTCFIIQGDHWLSLRVPIIGVRIFSSLLVHWYRKSAGTWNTVQIISGVWVFTVRINKVLLNLSAEYYNLNWICFMRYILLMNMSKTNICSIRSCLCSLSSVYNVRQSV